MCFNPLSTSFGEESLNWKTAKMSFPGILIYLLVTTRMFIVYCQLQYVGVMITAALCKNTIVH